MVDQPRDGREYRPAESRDFRRAVERVDETDLRAAAPPPTDPLYGPTGGGSTMGGAYSPASRDPTTRERAYALGEGGAYATTPAATTTTSTVEERRVADDAPRPFSIAAGFFGWAVASFFTLVLVTIVLAVLGASAYDATDAGASDISQETFNSLTMAGLAGVLVSLFIAYFLGGYAAGRIGLWHGVAHGAMVVVWTVLFSILAVALGVWLGDATGALSMIPAVDWSALTTETVIAVAVTLLVMLGGAILGSVLGTRTDAEDDLVERRRVGMHRGRPL